MIAALCAALVGCDQNAFTEDYPDPSSEGLPPYVSFDHTQLGAPWSFNAEQADRGSQRTIAYPATVVPPVPAAGQAAHPFLRLRLPTALEEDVTVNLSIGGTAVYGEDYRLWVLTQQGETWNWTEVQPQGGQASVVIRSFVVNPTLPAGSANTVTGSSIDMRIQALPNLTQTTARTLTIGIQGATAPSGRQISVGRLPDSRDNIATLTFAPSPLVAASFADCPEELEVGEEGTFTGVVNAAAARPIAFSWNFGDGTAAVAGQQVTHAYSAPGDYTATVTITGPLNTLTRTCVVEVVEAEDDDNGDD
jgi:hypothetical protein